MTRNNNIDHDIALDLATKFSPSINLHPRERLIPTEVEIMVHNSVLKRRGAPEDGVIVESPNCIDLFKHATSDYYLEFNKQNRLSLTSEGRYMPKVYARIVRDSSRSLLFIQYYLFYLYNDWLNQHEGDWEYIQVMFNTDDAKEIVIEEKEPILAAYSRHGSGHKRFWKDTQKYLSSHPVVYVGLGSHANYFRRATYFIPLILFRSGIYIGVGIERTGTKLIESPIVELIDDNISISQESGWLLFKGCWGKPGTGGLTENDGPRGPKYKTIWKNPLEWCNKLKFDKSTPLVSFCIPT